MATSGIRRLASFVAVSAILFSGICSVCPFAIRPVSASVGNDHKAHTVYAGCEGEAEADASSGEGSSVSAYGHAAQSGGCPMRHIDPGEIGPDSSSYRHSLLRSVAQYQTPLCRAVQVPSWLAADPVARKSISYLPRPPGADLAGTIVKNE